MTESELSIQLNHLIDVTIEKTMKWSQHLKIAALVSLVLLIISLVFSSASILMMLPFLIFNGIPIFVIHRMSKSMAHVTKLDTCRSEFSKLVDNQDNIKAKMKDMLNQTNGKLSVVDLMQRAKVFLDIKKAMKDRNVNISSTMELSNAISAIAMLGNPMTLFAIVFCYLWLILICLGALISIVF